MKLLRFLSIGILFGFILSKSEAISWYRIQEMFRFQSIHMYGIIGVAVIAGAIMYWFVTSRGIKNIDGEVIPLAEKPKNYKAAILGGTIFGMGWALTGACPGPLYILFGHGYTVLIVAIISGVFGTFIYGILRSRLPH
jgi:uncharacterized membrane protein YedE/YeeE